ncbi:hypothetical protein [Massilia cavernae]|uniref:Carboxypeptidase regulatory-like domain-containing protein n=1 Tax=Massilia cavernae TaxID=2320864 RepID=A0A418Y4G4_9BURK|nr:hypothetical protein [Massilia cavernae]RJG20647.1 hypothetical protein D3872_08120 [Massilia cavernae]
MKKVIAVLVMCSATLGMGAAHAHGTPTPNHGGVVQAVGETWLELVAKSGAVELYVEDDGEAMDSAPMSGKVTVVDGAKKSEYTLKPAGGNKLEAAGAVVPKGAKVVTVLVMADKKTKVAATFTPQ